MGDHHHGRALLFYNVFDNGQHLDACHIVKCRRRLVGQDQLWPFYDGACDRHALLLTARHLPGIVVRPIRQLHLGDRLLGTHGLINQFGNKLHVLQRGQIRHQIIGLKNKTDILTAIPRQFRVGRMRKILPFDEKLAVGKGVHPADDIHHGRFAAAGFTQYHNKLIFVNLKIDPLEDLQHSVARGELLCNVPEDGKDLLFFAEIDQQALFVDGDSGERGHMLAKAKLLFIKSASVLFVHDLQTSDNIMQIVQRDTDHALCYKAVIIKRRPVKSGIVRGIHHDNAFSRLCNNTLNTNTIINGDIGDVGRADVEHGAQPVGLAVQKPDRPGLAVEGPDDDLQAPGKRILKMILL